MEFEVELRRGGWIARVKGSKDEVKEAAADLLAILDSMVDRPVPETVAFPRQETDVTTLVAGNMSSVSLSEAILLTFFASGNKALTKQALANKLKQLGKAFSESTLEYRTVPSMRRKGLLHFDEVKAEGTRGQQPRAYFLTERGKIEAERIVNGLSNTKQ